jgi:DNA-binding winged helix-turn-helix (wHTH) protein
LNAAVKRLRAALGDDARMPQYIETLPRLGYRWINDAVPLEGRRHLSAHIARGGSERIEIVWT